MRKMIVAFVGVMAFAGVVFAQGTRGFSLETDSSSGSVATPLYTPTGKIPNLMVQEGHNGVVSCAKYSSDGLYIMSAGAHEVKIWDAKTCALIKTIPLEGNILGIDFNPNGKNFVYANAQKNIYLYTISTDENRLIDSVLNGASATCCISFSPDGALFAVDACTHIQVYNAGNQKKEFQLKDSRFDSYLKFCFSDDSAYLAAVAAFPSEKNHLHGVLFDVSAKKAVTSYDSTDILTAVAVSRDNRYIAYGTNVGTVIVIERGTLGIVSRISTGKKADRMYDLRFSPDSTKLFSLALTSAVSLWDINTAEKITYRSVSQPHCISFSPDGTSCLIGANSQVLEKTLTDGAVLKTIKGSSEISKMAYFADRDVFYTTKTALNTGSFFDLNFLKQESVENLKKVKAVRFSSYDSGFFYAASIGKNLQYFSFDDNLERTITSVDNRLATGALCASHDLNMVVYQDRNKVIYFYDRASKSVVVQYESGVKVISDSFFSPRSRFAVLDTASGDAEIADTEKWELIDIKGNNVSFSFDDAYCAINQDGAISIYDTKTWTVVKSIKGHHCYFLIQTGNI